MRFFMAVAVAWMTFTTSLTSALAQADECYEGDAFTCEVERLVAEYTNDYRVRSGRAPLAIHGHLAFVSRTWSEAQARRGSIGHDGFPYQREEAYRREFGSMEGIGIMGENVAMFSWGEGQTAAEVARQLTDQWWNSSGHRANMLGGFDGIGAGVVRDGSGYVYGTQIFYADD